MGHKVTDWPNWIKLGLFLTPQAALVTINCTSLASKVADLSLLGAPFLTDQLAIEVNVCTKQTDFSLVY